MTDAEKIRHCDIQKLHFQLSKCGSVLNHRLCSTLKKGCRVRSRADPILTNEIIITNQGTKWKKVARHQSGPCLRSFMSH